VISASRKWTSDLEERLGGIKGMDMLFVEIKECEMVFFPLVL